MALTKFDFLKGIDFSALGPATADDHNVLVDGAEPVIDSAQEARSINIWTADTADNTPIVPDPESDITFDKWKHYIWIRIPFAGSNSDLPYLYVWNDNAVADATLLKWCRPKADTTALETLIAALTVRMDVVEADIVAVQAIANAANNNAALAAVDAANAVVTANGASATATLANTNATAALAAAAAADDKADTAIENSASALTIAGTAATNAANANALAQAQALTLSVDYALTLSSVIATIVHGFGITPRKVRWVIGCTTNDAATGHVVGDEISYENVLVEVGPTNLPAIWSYANATNIIARTSNVGFSVFSTAGVLTAITMANWRARCYYSKA